MFANDIRPDAKAAWVSYFKRKYKNPDDIYHLESIVDLVKRAKEGEKVFPDNIDIVTGGFPCQDFSIAGKRLGFNSHKSHNGEKLEVDEPSIENRGQLYMWMREVVTLTKPLMFVAENVKGLTNLDDVKEVIERDFSNAGDGGYLVLPARVLHSADYGVPQSRERVIFYGFKKSALKSKALEELTQNIISKEYDPSNSMYIEDLKFVYNYKNKSQENKKYRAFDLSKPCKIEVRNLYFRYPNANEYALYNISFTIMPGEKVSIVGLNGSGKTTLIKLLLRFYEPEQGEIFINDINIKEYNKEDLQKNIGVVFQDHHVYAYTTKENIAFEEKIIENTYDVLGRLGMYKKIQAFPDGFNTYLSKEFYETGLYLSGGELQKICIARALNKPSGLYIFDEPSSALDIMSENNMNEVMMNSSHKTMIFISHRLSTVVMADKILVLQNGKLEECGNHSELIQKDGIYSELYRHQMKQY